VLDDNLASIVAEELNVKNIITKNNSELSVELNTEITQTLKNEGIARDIIRNIQTCRKEAGLQVENRIKLTLSTGSVELKNAIDEFKNFIIQETLTEDLFSSNMTLSFSKNVTVEGFELTIELEKK
jgi:isoleucyl-tRNA synthetase